jgi:hypothetical protein
MAPGDRAARPRFLLNDEEDVEAVASTSSEFAGLTIVPVPSVSSATGGWDIVGTGARGTLFAAASRASRSRGGVSVSSALTLSQFARIRSGQWSTCGSQSHALDLHLMLYSAGYEAWRTR